MVERFSLTPFHQMTEMGKKCDLSDFDCGMIIGARQGGLSISETVDLLWFSGTHQSLEFAAKTSNELRKTIGKTSSW